MNDVLPRKPFNVSQQSNCINNEPKTHRAARKNKHRRKRQGFKRQDKSSYLNETSLCQIQKLKSLVLKEYQPSKSIHQPQKCKDAILYDENYPEDTSETTQENSNKKCVPTLNLQVEAEPKSYLECKENLVENQQSQPTSSFTADSQENMNEVIGLKTLEYMIAREKSYTVDPY